MLDRPWMRRVRHSRCLRSAWYYGFRRRPFGVYVHVPFCATRCGYCDFNTYTAGELGTSASPQSWLDGLRRDRPSRARSMGAPRTRADTVFVGGGTPSLLGGRRPGRVLGRGPRERSGWPPDAEVTTEANPESTSPEFFARLRAAGYTRISLGMQSAAPHVLAVLDRTPHPGPRGGRRAGGAGGRVRARQPRPDLRHAGGDRRRLRRARWTRCSAAGVDHVSAYALIVEDGTRLARRVRRGELPAPDDDVLAARYERSTRRSTAAGLHLVRGVELGARDAGALPAQPGLLARRRLVGRRAGRAQPCRRRALVERQAPGALRGPAGRRASCRSGGRGARPRRTATSRRSCCSLRLVDGLPLTVLDADGAAARAAAGRPTDCWSTRRDGPC